MKEIGQFPQPEEIGSVEAALKLAGDNAKKTATLIFNILKENPVICVGSVGMAMMIGAMGGAVMADYFHQLDNQNIILGTGLLGVVLFMTALCKHVRDYPDLGEG